MKAFESHRNIPPRRAHGCLLREIALAALAALGGAAAQAQTVYTVPDGSAFSAAGVPASPANGSVINLGGTASLATLLTLPTGGQLSIAGPASGGTLALGGSGRFSGSNTTLNLTGVAITGATASALTATVGLAINTQGAVSINGNSNSGGGAISASAINANTSPINIVGAITFDGNSATSSTGGAINATNKVTMSGGNVTLSNNRAQTSGGAIFTSSNTTVPDVRIGDAASTVTMTGNTANSGGAVFVMGGQVVLTGSQITLTGNTASAGGGAIQASSNNNTFSATAGNITINGPLTASGNSSVSMGGALSSAGMAPGGHVTQDGGDIVMDGNTSSGSGGGAIYTYYGNVNLAATTGNVSLTNNTAAYGGAIFAGVSNVTMGHAGGLITITGNKGTGNNTGGAIYAWGNVAITGGANISNNSTTDTGGRNGGAVWANGNFSLTATAPSTIAGNSATGVGGALWVGGNLALTASGGDITFSGNQQTTLATAQANAIYLYSNTIGAATATFDTAGHTIALFDPIGNLSTRGQVTVTASGGGTLAFDGANYSAPADLWSPLYGATTVQSGTTFAVRNQAIYGALASDVGQATPTSFTAPSGATLTGGTAGEVRANNFTLAGTLNVPGAQTNSGNTFTISSGSANLAGATVKLNAGLGALASDQLIINGGNLTGPATIEITNIGNLGAATTGDGILIVDAQNGATTATDAFTLQGGPITAGGHTYELLRGGVNPANAPNSWFLRSKSAASTGGISAVPTLSTLALAVLALAMLAIAGLGRKRRA